MSAQNKESYQYIKPIELTRVGILLGTQLRMLGEFLEEKRHTPISGAEHIEKTRSLLANGKNVIATFFPHTHTFDPLVINETVWRTVFALDQDHFHWFAGAKFGYRIPGMKPMKKIPEWVITAYTQEHYIAHHVVQDRVINNEITPFINRENLRGKLSLKFWTEDEKKQLLGEVDKFNRVEFRNVLKIIRKGSGILFCLSPEATRNPSGGILRVGDMLPNLLGKESGDIVVAPYAIKHASNLKPIPFLGELPIVALPPMTLDDILDLNGQLKWKQPMKKLPAGFTLTDTVAWLTAQQLGPEDVLKRGKNPRGMYSDQFVGFTSRAPSSHVPLAL